MEGMTTQEQLLGQDDIDALLAGADAEESSSSSGTEDSETTNGEDTSNGLLGQDDIDALLSQVGSDREDDDELDDPDPIDRLRGPEKVSDEYVRSLSVQIYNRSLLLREPGVQVIWNALDTLPLNTGMNLNIQGIEYKTLGILHSKHLVVKDNT